LNAARPETSKSGLGGIGIRCAREVLQEFSGGSLTYRETKGGRIIADAVWKE